MPTNSALHAKPVAEIGTYNTHPYKCVACRVFIFTWCGFV